MNVYDFDHTIYSGDCTIDFWWYCIRRKPSVLLALPRAIFAAARFRLGRCGREEFKETFYRFLQYLPDAEEYIRDFWAQNLRRIQPWYLKQRETDDLVISASPDFLVSVACVALGIRWLASPVDRLRGRLLGPNCRGEEKVRRLHQAYPGAVVGKFYSDSQSDQPLADLAEQAFLLKGGKIHPWRGKGNG